MGNKADEKTAFLAVFWVTFITPVSARKPRRSKQKIAATAFFADALWWSDLGHPFEGNDCDLRRTAEAKRQSDGADAAIYVELHSVFKLEKTLHIPSSHLREKQRGQEGEADLASVRMAGEDQGDVMS
jgi:hypothetical protein